ncbi:hypothetical protein C8J57DRAFT_277039 [Mycena rebaudengoi]|nr:hypothetical protein C8J57DRAFT_277039 [Mycena rebaudengoi]
MPRVYTVDLPRLVPRAPACLRLPPPSSSTPPIPPTFTHANSRSTQVAVASIRIVHCALSHLLLLQSSVRRWTNPRHLGVPRVMLDEPAYNSLLMAFPSALNDPTYVLSPLADLFKCLAARTWIYIRIECAAVIDNGVCRLAPVLRVLLAPESPFDSRRHRCLNIRFLFVHLSSFSVPLRSFPSWPPVPPFTAINVDGASPYPKPI